MFYFFAAIFAACLLALFAVKDMHHIFLELIHKSDMTDYFDQVFRVFSFIVKVPVSNIVFTNDDFVFLCVSPPCSKPCVMY